MKFVFHLSVLGNQSLTVPPDTSVFFAYLLLPFMTGLFLFLWTSVHPKPIIKPYAIASGCDDIQGRN